MKITNLPRKHRNVKKSSVFGRLCVINSVNNDVLLLAFSVFSFSFTGVVAPLQKAGVAAP